MDKNLPLIPLCRMFENTSAKGNGYLVGNLTYTTKLVAFQEETDDGQIVWQLYVQERPAKSPAAHQGGRSPSMGGKAQPTADTPAAGDYGGIEGGDYPVRSRSRQ